MSAPIKRRRFAGITLIELIVFIVIVGIALAGVLTVLNVVVRGSADPLRPKQAIALADAMLEEILLKPYCDPNTADIATAPPTCGVNAVEANRSNYDDVFDYHGYDTDTLPCPDTSFAHCIVDISGDRIPGLENYRLAVAVIGTASISDGALNVPNVAQATVTVSVDGQDYSLTGYRTNY